MLATKPHETKLREGIYARVAAHREFISLLMDFIQKKQQAELTPKDHLDIIDDPDVHNIYEGRID